MSAGKKLQREDLPPEILDLQAGLHRIQGDLLGEIDNKEEDEKALMDLSFEDLHLEVLLSTTSVLLLTVLTSPNRLKGDDFKEECLYLCL